MSDSDTPALLSPRLRGLVGAPYGPPVAAIVVSAVLQLAWFAFLATSGGDMAAQDAWAEFARQHPDSAYDLAWYGGIHPMSYSMVAPYVMASLGVRTTMVVSSVLAAGVLTWIVTHRERAGLAAYLVAAAGAAAFLGNAVSGRVTFALGTLFALIGLCVVVAWPAEHARTRPRRWMRATAACVLAACATASSPVAGLFLGLAAAAMWVRGQRAAAYQLGVPPLAVVILSAALFPFAGRQTMSGNSAILPVVMGLSVMLLAPRQWRVLRAGGAIYILATILAWLVPSPVGSNIVRLGLMFGGVALIASCALGRWRTSPLARAAGPRVAGVLLGAAIATSAVWQVVLPAKDAARGQSPVAWQADVSQLVHELDALHANVGRVEVVPTRSHRESTLLATHVALARGWNRQADVGRNDLFYTEGALTPETYRAWLDRWAARFVVLSRADPDTAAVAEARLISRGLPYLTRVWSNSDWSVYAVQDPTPLITPPATVVTFDADELVIKAPHPGAYEVRVVASPWLRFVDADGKALPGVHSGHTAPACISSLWRDERDEADRGQSDDWLTLHVEVAGIYRIAAPYKFPSGSTCRT
jgi:hypothetical protein